MWLAAIWMLALGPARAADPSAAELRALADAHPPPKGADAQILDERARWSIAADGTIRHDVHQVVLLVDADGVSGWSTVQLRWTPWYVDAPVIQARVIGSDGQVHALKASEISEGPASEDADVHGDDRLASAPMPAVAPGAILDLHWTVTEHEPFFRAGREVTYALGGVDPVVHTSLVITTDKAHPITWKAVGAEVAVHREKHGDQRVLRLEAGALPEWTTPFEVARRADDPAYPYVAFSHTPSWQAVAEAYDTLVEPAVTAPLPDGFAQHVIDAKVSDRERVQRPLAAIHTHVRYTGLELGEAAMTPSPPAETLSRGYGDCRDQAALQLPSCARREWRRGSRSPSRGPGSTRTPTCPASTHSRSPSSPCRAPTCGSTPRRCTPGRVCSRPTSRGGGHWSRLPTPARSCACPRSPRPGPSTTRTATSPSRSSARARWWSAARPPAGSTAPFARAPTTRTTSGRSVPTASEPTPATRPMARSPPPKDLDTPFQVTVTVHGAEMAYTREGSAVVRMPPDAVLDWLPRRLLDAKAPRVHDLALAPERTEIVYEVHLPPGLVVDPIPPIDVHHFGAMTARREVVQAAPREVDVRFSLDAGDVPLSPADAQAFVTWAQGISGSSYELKIAEEIPRSIRAGDLAGALVDAGFGLAARAEAKRATELAPDSARAWDA